MTPLRTLPSLLLALTTQSALTAGSVAAADFPPRKPGLWEMKIDLAGGKAMTARHCVDAATDAAMQRAGRGAMGGSCSQDTFVRDGAGWRGESVCKFGDTKLTSRSVVTGDFDSAFKMEIDSRYEPPMMGKSQDHTTIAWRWTGACPAGWKPGEMEMPGTNKRMNVMEMMGGGAKGK